MNFCYNQLFSNVFLANFMVIVYMYLLLHMIPQLPVLSFCVDKLPMSQTVMGIWSSLVRLASSSPSHGHASALSGSLFQPPSLTQTPSKPLVPVNDSDLKEIPGIVFL